MEGLLALALLACNGSDRHASPPAGAGSGGGATTTSTSSGGPQPTRAYDLDRDGVAETDLSVGACVAQAERLCLLITSPLDVEAEVLLPEGAVTAAAGTGMMVGDEIHALGDFGGGNLSEVSVLFQLGQASHTSPALGVIDCEAGAVLNTTSAPPALSSFGFYGLASFTTFLRDPDNRDHPVLAPGYGDNAEQLWGEACLFDGSSAASGNCGEGFVRLDTVPLSAPGWFREVGGYAFDMNTDGWEDLTLIYHSRVITFDGHTGARLGETVYDVAATDEPASPPLFHSGRNYGTHATHLGSDGKIRTVMVGGTPVGAFDDHLCNVTRFVAALDLDPGAVAARRLAFSDYFGFYATTFSVWGDPAFASAPASVVARKGDFTDGCIHRFSTSLTIIDGQEAVLFNVFDAPAPVDDCLVEQYALYIEPTWTPEKSDAWYTCAAKNVGTLGTWGMQARRRSDGVSITGSLQTYVWGWSDELLPSGEVAYLVEMLPELVRFDRADVSETHLTVMTLVNGLWQSVAVLPVAGPPKINLVAARGPNGVGSGTGLAELSLRDADDDGLAEFELAGGQWLEYDGSSFAVQP